MSSPGSVTVWIDMLKAGDAAAAQPLWEAYFRRLVGLARARLGGVARPTGDEEDMALSAFHSFWRGAEQGRFPQLNDRNDLWQVLVMLTARKAARLIKHETRPKRGGGRVLNEAALPPDGSSSNDAGLARFIGPEPTPEFAAEVADECRRRLEALGDESLRSVALWKMEGDANQEIAGKLGCAERTVERKLGVIRKLWETESEP